MADLSIHIQFVPLFLLQAFKQVSVWLKFQLNDFDVRTSKEIFVKQEACAYDWHSNYLVDDIAWRFEINLHNLNRDLLYVLLLKMSGFIWRDGPDSK